MDAELIAEACLADSGPVIQQYLQSGLASSSSAGRSPTPLLVLGRLIGSQSVYCIVDSTACDTFLGKVLDNVGCFHLWNQFFDSFAKSFWFGHI